MINKANKIIAIVLWVYYCLLLIKVSNPFYGFLFFAPFSLFPHAINLKHIYKRPSKSSQYYLFAGQLIYFCWFTYIYLDAFIFNLDAQSSIVLLFVGLFSLPVMLIVWILSRIQQNKDNKSEPESE